MGKLTAVNDDFSVFEGEWKTLGDILRYRGQHQSNKTAYVFLQDGETESGSLTYGELDRQARAIASHLQSIYQSGVRALLIYPPGLEFIAAFFGCLYAGVLAVPAYPPRKNQKLLRLQAIVADAQAAVVLTTNSLLSNLEEGFPQNNELARLHWVASDRLSLDLASRWQNPELNRDNLAFVQYTSGSTGTPKGVMVTHGNLMHNQQMITEAFGHSEQSIVVGWLPLFHDMGLIGNVLQPIFLGIPSILMSPVAFLQKPIRWLKAISRYEATTSGGPNFAYDFCVGKIKPEDLAAINLSSWEVAFNGAEPVRAETLAQFAEKFALCGFKSSAFYPCYGMAEATLFITGGVKSIEPVVRVVDGTALEPNKVVFSSKSKTVSRKLVGCGSPWLETKVIIVDRSNKKAVGEGEVGEIWVSGSTVAAGYWNRPEETQATFGAYLADTGAGPFLRTGDLGFLLHEQLYVTGRIKDVIIIRGRNYYPQDIELTVEKSHRGIRRGCSAAFSLEVAGEERLAIACEVERTSRRNLNIQEVVAAVRHGVWMEHDLKIYKILLLKTGSIPKTSSGKIQRRASRQGWLDKQLHLVGEWTEGELVEQINIEGPPTMQNLSNEGDPSPTQERASQTRADEILTWLRQYARERINSRLIDERRCIPPYIVLDFGNEGLLGLQVPLEYGGLGLNNQDTLRVLEQLGAIDQTLGLFVGNHNILGVNPIMKYASDRVKQQLLPQLATGRKIAAFALTEPGAGSNPRAISARAIPNASEGWLLQGTKIWSGSAAWASAINIFVRHLDRKGQPMGISAFVVEQGAKGLQQGPEALTMGMRGMVQNKIFLQGVSVSSEQLLGEAGAGLKVALDAMMYGRLGLAAGCIGGMKRCAQLMLRYGSRRAVSNGSLLENPVTLVRLGDLTAAITTLETLVFTIARLLDLGCEVPEEAYTACKTSGPEFFWQAADNLVQLLGGRGYIETNIAPQILRDARVLRIFEGPTETLNMFLGSRVIQKGEELYQFLSATLGVPEISDRLKAAVEQIGDRLTSSPTFSEHHTALRWVYVCTGELATWAILLAAVKGDRKQSGSEPLHRAVAWTELQFEQKLQQVLRVTPGEMVRSDVDSVSSEISDYAETIGDIEQTMAGEDRELDEFLCQTPKVEALHNSEFFLEFNSHNEPEDVIIEKQVTKLGEERKLHNIDIIESWIETWLAKQPEIKAKAIKRQTSFADYGMDSVLAVELIEALENWLEITLEPTILWNFPTIESLAQYLESEMPTKEEKEELSAVINSSDKEEFKPSETELQTSIVTELTALENLLGNG
ncbi:MAG: AMP-binding protein [Xenococcaceae cyanobacterium]